MCCDVGTRTWATSTWAASSYRDHHLCQPTAAAPVLLPGVLPYMYGSISTLQQVKNIMDYCSPALPTCSASSWFSRSTAVAATILMFHRVVN